jgi:hypothetical protein
LRLFSVDLTKHCQGNERTMYKQGTGYDTKETVWPLLFRMPIHFPSVKQGAQERYLESIGDVQSYEIQHLDTMLLCLKVKYICNAAVCDTLNNWRIKNQNRIIRKNRSLKLIQNRGEPCTLKSP